MREVRTAREDEFDRVMDFYSTMIDQMAGTDFDVRWKHGVHPSPEFLRAAVDAGQVHVLMVRDDAHQPCIAAAIVLDGDAAKGYERVPWGVAAAPDEVWVVHVLATLPAFHGRGFARDLMLGGLKAARAAGKRAVRLDVFPDNVRARRLYEACGFKNKGTFPLLYEDLGPANFCLYECAL